VTPVEAQPEGRPRFGEPQSPEDEVATTIIDQREAARIPRAERRRGNRQPKM
jgi:hypothetical protein